MLVRQNSRFGRTGRIRQSNDFTDLCTLEARLMVHWEVGDLRTAPIGAGRDDAIGDEEAREARLTGKAQIEPDRRNRLVGPGQPLDRALHPQRIQIDVRRDTDLLAEQLVEVGSRQACLARDRVELDRLAHPLLQELDRFAQPEVMNAREAPDGIAAAPGLVEAVFGQGSAANR